MIDHTKVLAGEGMYAVAARLAPKGIALTQRNAFASTIAAANGLKGPSAVIYAGQVLHYHTEDVPAAPVVTPPPPPPVPAGSRPFSANSLWNTPTPTGTQWFDHPQLHASEGHWYVNESSMRVVYAADTDPLCTFILDRFVDPTFNRNRPATTLQARCPVGAVPGTDEDHIFYLEQPNGDYLELWQAIRSGDTFTAQGWATGNARTGTGMGGLVADGGNNGGVRAANFSWRGGLITGTDVANNRIDHALVLALGWGWLDNTTWRHPATAPDNGGHNGPFIMGTKFGIPHGTPRPPGLSPLGNAIFDAFINYGAYVGDFAGTPYPLLYSDAGTVGEHPAVRRLFVWWDSYVPDMDILSPLIRIADYQP
jgi:hypothetical protein